MNNETSSKNRDPRDIPCSPSADDAVNAQDTKRLEEVRKIKELNQTITSLLNNMPGMTFTKDAGTGVYLACNQAFARYAHKETPEGVVGLTDAQIFDAETAAHFVEDDQTALKMEKPFIFFEDVPDAAGNQRQFQTTKFKYTDSTGRLCLQGMCQDVTDMVRIRRENATTKEAYKEARNTVRTYTHVAHALARGYMELFYVNLETAEFIEFHTDDESGVLTEARRGTDFFKGCEKDAEVYVYPDDRKAFIKAMDREFLSRALSESKVFEMTYRRKKEENKEEDEGGEREENKGEKIEDPFYYVQMKVSRMEDDERFIVIAVSDIDELMRQRRAQKRIREERVIYARLHALTGNFLCVYVVDPRTGRYREFSSTLDYEQSFAQEKKGENFFKTLKKAARIFSHPADRTRVLKVLSMENFLAEIRRSGVFTLDYRIMKDGRPFYVQMKAAMVEEKEGTRMIVGLSDINAEYQQREIERQKDIYDQITSSLAEQYDTLYVIDIATSTYIEISSTDEYKKLNVPATGNDFFAESRRSIRKYVHPKDKDKAIRIHYKDVMLDNLKKQRYFSLEYRLKVKGVVSHIRHTEIMAKDGKHIIVCIKNIDAEIRARLAIEEDQKKREIYTRIAERLASRFDLIYYIDCKSLEYAEYSTKEKNGELKIQDKGDNFFEAASINIDKYIYDDDRDRIRAFLDKDHLISQLETSWQLTQDYRMILSDKKKQYTRMSVTYSSDHSHFIICVENREEVVRREKEHLEALTVANEMARRDALTHTKNKTAYHEMERELQGKIKEGKELFGIVVCDINGLKIVNDTEGHRAGDEYIKASCRLICRIFAHSPVFRIGGDEFVVILRGEDFDNRVALLSVLRKQVEENIRMGEGPVVASGLAELVPVSDHTVEEVFNRADGHMYADKARLKEKKHLQESYSLKDKANFRAITGERRIKLDALYKAFEVVSEGTYVFLCDMKYDFSRWSKSAVDSFGLPSEYMYGAGDIWENQIHPEDREEYHKGIDELFAGNAAGHDMQYRARRVTGEYDVCTCRGVVIRDQNGELDYFAGAIRNHGIQGHVDTLTGLRNQYGFFEDLDGFIKRNTGISVILFGISRFSEINEMHGYHFGNRVLQVYSRSIVETIMDRGHVYRIDGTKFAVISKSLSIEELRENYDRFRDFLHESFKVDDRKILLDLHGGALRLEDLDVDSQTVYACLNFADEESKVRHQGDLVEFRNDLNEESRQRLEKLHAIRASIMHGYEGFYLLYQPVVDAQTEQLIGAEALLRWKDDRFGMVPPDQYIPILESDPLFPELGEWIIRESVLAAKKILRHHQKFIMNVNLSYTQLEKPDFVDMVLRILNELEYPPEHLCFEVTERCRLLDLELLKNVVASLKSRGVLVALDDFGTGFSSVGILKEIPVNIIKIDRSFVKMIEENEVDRKIVRTIADLASIFSAKVCVEGIETRGMRDILKNYQVESFQGYYYAKPLLLDQFLDWYRKAK